MKFRMNCRTSGAKRNKLYDTLLFPPAARCSECERLSFSSVQVWIKDSLKEGSYKTVIAALVFSVPAVSDAIQKMDSYKKTLQGGFERTYQLVTG